MIEAEGLTRRFGRRVAVDHIDFTVRAGEIFGFLGPNAAGKTTTQRMLTGVLPPTEGIVRVLGHDMTANPLEAKQHIGVVPEAANPYVELSGWQNMEMFGGLYGVPARRRHDRAEALLREFELWQRRRDRVRKYSKGMRQRLMFAMALVHEPRVLCLDEPTSGLDVASRRIIHSMVRRLATEGRTIFYTTHDIAEANLLCDRVAIISGGVLAAVDTPEALKATFTGSQGVEVAFARPQDPAALAALPQVHRVDKHGDKLHLYTGRPAEVCGAVVDFARQGNLEIVALGTLGPSLEEVFLRLTESGGRRP